MSEQGMAVARAAVVGAGTMGSGIAIVFADAGIRVDLLDSDSEALERAQRTIDAWYAGRVAKGRLTPPERDERVRAIDFGTDLNAAAGADAVVEAVFESLDLKRDIFRRLGEIAQPDALLATNTSTLDVDAIAAAAPHPERSLGLHFFSPAQVMRLVEIVRGSRTAPETVARATALAQRLCKLPVVVGNCDGFVGNRMLLPYRREAEFLVLEGATPAQVDGALEVFGFAMGPFAVADLAGVDIGVRAKRERAKRGAVPPYALTSLSDRLVAEERLGRKSGKGWYQYEDGGHERMHDPAVSGVVDAERTARGVAPRAIRDEEIVERCLYALVNEGARILGEGVASSAADVDAIWVNGYGFPKERGGPMQYADGVGPANVLAAIRRLAERDPAFWRPAPRLVEIAESGAHFRT